MTIQRMGYVGVVVDDLSTAAKHGRPLLDTLVMLAEGRP